MLDRCRSGGCLRLILPDAGHGPGLPSERDRPSYACTCSRIIEAGESLASGLQGQPLPSNAAGLCSPAGLAAHFDPVTSLLLSVTLDSCSRFLSRLLAGSTDGRKREIVLGGRAQPPSNYKHRRRIDTVSPGVLSTRPSHPRPQRSLFSDSLAAPTTSRDVCDNQDPRRRGRRNPPHADAAITSALVPPDFPPFLPHDSPLSPRRTNVRFLSQSDRRPRSATTAHSVRFAPVHAHLRRSPNRSRVLLPDVSSRPPLDAHHAFLLLERCPLYVVHVGGATGAPANGQLALPAPAEPLDVGQVAGRPRLWVRRRSGLVRRFSGSRESTRACIQLCAAER